MKGKEGRRSERRSWAEAKQLAGAFEASGLTRRQYCERNDICVNTQGRYLKRYRQEQGGGSASQPWVEIEMAQPSSAGKGLVLVLGKERRIEVGSGFDGATLRELVRALERI